MAHFVAHHCCHSCVVNAGVRVHCVAALRLCLDTRNRACSASQLSFSHDCFFYTSLCSIAIRIVNGNATCSTLPRASATTRTGLATCHSIAVIACSRAGELYCTAPFYHTHTQHNTTQQTMRAAPMSRCRVSTDCPGTVQRTVGQPLSRKDE